MNLTLKNVRVLEALDKADSGAVSIKDIIEYTGFKERTVDTTIRTFTKNLIVNKEVLGPRKVRFKLTAYGRKLYERNKLPVLTEKERDENKKKILYAVKEGSYDASKQIEQLPKTTKVRILRGMLSAYLRDAFSDYVTSLPPDKLRELEFHRLNDSVVHHQVLAFFPIMMRKPVSNFLRLEELK